MSTNFFELDNGEELEPTTEFVTGGIQPLIPEGEELHVEIVAATWEEPTTWKNKRIEVQLYVVQPGPYRDFVVKDTIKLFDDEIKTVNKARQKLNTYDSLCKGLLRKSMAAGKDIEDDQGVLKRALGGCGLMVTFGIWEMKNENTGDTRTGNMVRKLSALPKNIKQEDKAIINKAKNQPNAPQTDPIKMGTSAPLSDDEYDDDIPF